MASMESNFPTLKAYARLNSMDRNENTSFFDVKFYPYTAPGVDPVFAIVGMAETIVCRPAKEGEEPIEILRWFHDNEPGVNLNSCVWSRDPITGDPLLCVAGLPHGVIKIFNITTGDLVRTLTGHGKSINDLAISPLSPSILASASADYTVRFWSLDPTHSKQPCMLICGGEGHKEGLLTLAFHDTGRYLLTGGMDCVINLWTIPLLPNDATGTDKPTILHYPHFSTSAVHTDFVDCITFHTDLILSKSATTSTIHLWRIENFSPTHHPPPPPSTAPTTHEYTPTRSAFGGTYQRLLTFSAPETTPFFMRFALHTAPGMNPVLAVGNDKSKVYFWDLGALEAWDGTEVVSRNKGGRPRKNKGREESVASSEATTTTTGGTNASGLGAGVEGRIGGVGVSRVRFGVEDPWRGILPHRTITVPRITFAGRQVAWSRGGECMVVVGDQGMVALFAR